MNPVSTSSHELSRETLWILAFYVGGVLVATWLLASVLFSGALYQTSFTLVALILAPISVWRGGGLLLLPTIQIYLVLREPPQVLSTDFNVTCLAAFLTLLLLAFVYRLQTLLACHQLTTISSWIQQVRLRRISSTLTAPISKPIFWQFAGIVLGLTASMLMTVLIFTWVPRQSSSLRYVGLQPTGLRVIQIAFILAATYLLVHFFVGQLSWRRMSQPQARIFLRAALLGWLRNDFRGMTRGAIRLRRRNEKSAKN